MNSIKKAADTRGFAGHNGWIKKFDSQKTNSVHIFTQLAELAFFS